jgi:tetratricopeptide (TPR) repeat protein
MATKLNKAQLKTLRQSLITASDSGHHATTLKLADKYLESDPTSLRALLDKCTALVELRQYNQAHTCFAAAIKLAEEKGEVPDVIYGMIGNLHQAKGEYDLAESKYRKQIELDPTDATGFFFLGTLQLSRGEIESAQQTFADSDECQQGSIELAQLGLGHCFRSQSQFPEALQAYEKALKMDPKLDAAKIAIRDIKAVQA